MPDFPVISARRAYLEAIGIYMLFFGPSIVLAIASLANWTEPNIEGWWITGSSGFNELTEAALVVVVVLLLAHRRGRRPRDVGLAIRPEKGGPGWNQAVRMAAWALLAFLVGSIVTGALATGHFPFGHNQLSNTVLDLTAAANAGVTEELLVLGFILTTLEQARRPRWEILVVALACRGAYHIYYGPGVVGILIWALVFIWLFWRFRSVVPMLIIHIIWDTFAFLDQVTKVAGGFLLLLLVGLGIAAFVLWLVDRDRRSRGPLWAAPPMVWGAPPGSGGWGAPAAAPWNGGGWGAPWGSPPPSSPGGGPVSGRGAYPGPASAPPAPGSSPGPAPSASSTGPYGEPPSGASAGRWLPSEGPSTGDR